MDRPPRGPGSWQTPRRADGPDNRTDYYGGASGPVRLYDVGFRANIPILYDLWSKKDFKGTVDLWHHLLANVSERNKSLVFGMISDVLPDYGDVQDFIQFLRQNQPGHLQSNCITQPLPTQHFCALLESLHSRISALEERAQK